MKFNLFVYCTVGRRQELEAGMAGRNPELYQRMIQELGRYAEFAERRGYFGFGHPEHHLQIEGFEASNDPCLMASWLGRHTERLRIITCGFVSTANNPLATAEKIATLDHMLGGRFGVGLVRGYQARWVENFKVRPELKAVGPWNKKSADDDLNREYFAEFVEVVLKALTNETFSHKGKFWTFPPKGFVNPHEHPVYARFGKGWTRTWAFMKSASRLAPCRTPSPCTAASPLACAPPSSGPATRGGPSCCPATRSFCGCSGASGGRRP